LALRIHLLRRLTILAGLAISSDAYSLLLGSGYLPGTYLGLAEVRYEWGRPAKICVAYRNL